jgi:hypothetical protein
MTMKIRRKSLVSLVYIKSFLEYHFVFVLILDVNFLFEFFVHKLILMLNFFEDKKENFHLVLKQSTIEKPTKLIDLLQEIFKSNEIFS